MTDTHDKMQERDNVNIDTSKTTRVKKHILIADDNRANVLIAKTILERDGYLITCVHDGLQAVNAISACMLRDGPYYGKPVKTPFDIILMDVLMPVMDGLKALRRIKALSEYLEIPPIFAFTAFCSPGDQSRYRMSGFDAILTKPLKSGDVQRALDACNTGKAFTPKKPSQVSTPNFDTVSLIDQQMINQLISLSGPEDLKLIEQTFWCDINTILKAIAQSLPGAMRAEATDVSELRRSIHGLKGVCASIGLLRSTHIARRLQNAPPSQIRGLMMALFQTLILSKAPLNAAFGSPAPPAPHEGHASPNQSYAEAQHYGADAQTG